MDLNIIDMQDNNIRDMLDKWTKYIQDPILMSDKRYIELKAREAFISTASLSYFINFSFDFDELESITQEESDPGQYVFRIHEVNSEEGRGALDWIMVNTSENRKFKYEQNSVQIIFTDIRDAALFKLFWI